MAAKTEKATPKKLRDARKKGQVAKSQDFPSAITFIVSISTVLSLAGYLFKQLGGNMIANFSAIMTQPDMQYKAGGFIYQSLMVILYSSLPIMGATTLIGWLVNFLLVGPLFSAEVLKPDLKRLNPITNIKNLFKFKTLFELLKSLFKITGAVIIIYSVIYNKLPDIISTTGLPIIGIAQVFADFLFQVIIRVGIFFLAIAIADLIYQRRRFANEMKMEKFEVKQEHKDTEGDPQLKSRRKQTAQELAYQEGPSAVRRAKAVITNPIHIAVAIDYNADTEPAPHIVTMGAGAFAEKMIEFAVEFNIPVMRNVPLAQDLYNRGDVNQFIPEDTYQTVAEILKWLESIEAAGEEAVLPEFLEP